MTNNFKCTFFHINKNEWVNVGEIDLSQLPTAISFIEPDLLHESVMNIIEAHFLGFNFD